jgi:ribosomal protein S18 acetylase RimI-like enzyme
MFTFSNTHITIATPTDVADITALLNSAYRGESSKQGWTTEAHLIAGDVRTDTSSLERVMKAPGSIIVKYSNEQQEITGCVNLHHQGNRLYLGMFSVAPQSQGFGIGKQLLKAADEYAKHLQCAGIFMQVISAREELINWYIRNGYKATGERKPFIEDGLTGKHLEPLEFMIMEKSIVL